MYIQVKFDLFGNGVLFDGYLRIPERNPFINNPKPNLMFCELVKSFTRIRTYNPPVSKWTKQCIL